MGHYVHVRQQYLTNPSHSSTAQARTVLVTGIPPNLTEFTLRRLFSHLPGGVDKVWINRDLGDMPELYDQRLKACQKLESAAASLLRKEIKRRNGKQVANTAKSEDSRDIVERPLHRPPPFSWMPFSIPLFVKKVDTIDWACKRIQELNGKLARQRESLERVITEAETTGRTS